MRIRELLGNLIPRDLRSPLVLTPAHFRDSSDNICADGHPDSLSSLDEGNHIIFQAASFNLWMISRATKLLLTSPFYIYQYDGLAKFLLPPSGIVIPSSLPPFVDIEDNCSPYRHIESLHHSWTLQTVADGDFKITAHGSFSNLGYYLSGTKEIIFKFVCRLKSTGQNMTLGCWPQVIWCVYPWLPQVLDCVSTRSGACFWNQSNQVNAPTLQFIGSQNSGCIRILLGTCQTFCWDSSSKFVIQKLRVEPPSLPFLKAPR